MSVPVRPQLFSPAFRRILWRVLVVLAIFHAAFLFLVWFPENWMRQDRFRDLVIYYDAAVRLKNGQPIYQPWPQYLLTDIPSRFFYPPPFLLLIRPLAELNFLWFGRIWSCFLLLGFWIYALCLSKLATGKTEWRAVLVAGMVIDLFPRGHAALGYGNFEPIIWACYGIALATSFRAVPLALAAMVKLHPIWVLALVIRDEGRRALFPALGVFALGIAGGVWMCGWRSFLVWWPASSPVVSQGTLLGDNVSLSFLPLRLLFTTGALSTEAWLPAWARLYLSVMALGAPLVT
ncbi:MAG: DUF2029 domain-containing protein, partial [Armatimonadetes bacterium]|nr:DUF2029 domain-containing protein [Armatimonadota bacterium]